MEIVWLTSKKKKKSYLNTEGEFWVSGGGMKGVMWPKEGFYKEKYILLLLLTCTNGCFKMGGF